MKSIIVTTIQLLLMAICFIPEIAEARLKGSGIGNSTVDVANFELDTSLSDSLEGIFNNALLTLDIRRTVPECELLPINTSCNVIFSNGTIAASAITVNDPDLVDFGFTFSDLNNNDKNDDGILDSEQGIPQDPNNVFDFSNGGVKYEATFLGSDAKAVFFVPLPDNNPSTLTNYLTSLSNLESLTRIQALVSGVPSPDPTKPTLGSSFGFNTSRDPLTTFSVPEPTSVPENHTVASLIFVAGALLFFKAHPSSKKNLL